MKKILWGGLAALALTAGCAKIERIQLPEGYRIDYWPGCFEHVSFEHNALKNEDWLYLRRTHTYYYDKDCDGIVDRICSLPCVDREPRFELEFKLADKELANWKRELDIE